jgi:hypothetical protein
MGRGVGGEEGSRVVHEKVNIWKRRVHLIRE